MNGFDVKNGVNWVRKSIKIDFGLDYTNFNIDADQSNNLKVISDLVITQSDEFEIFNDHLDQKRPRTFKIYGLEI